MNRGATKLKLAIFWCALFALVGIVLLGGLEAVLRIALKRTLTAETGFPLIRSSFPGLEYQLEPNHSAGGIQTDANGFRSRPDASASARYNILIVGDSISFGSGVPYAKSYVPALETRLNQRLGENTAVWNAAVPGYNTSQEAAMLTRAAPMVKPDLVIVQFCMNDYLDPPVLTPGGNLDQSVSIAESGGVFSPIALLYHSRALVFLKEKFKDLERARPEWFPVWAHYIHRVQKKPGWQRAKQALLRIQESNDRIHARMLLVIFPVEQQLRIGDRAADDDLLEFARQHGIDTLDLYDSFRAHWREGLYIDFWEQVKQFDKLHPNVRGHALAAEQIAALIVAQRDHLLERKEHLISSAPIKEHAERSSIR
jgi:lysophospholipase L1-like esterase